MGTVSKNTLRNRNRYRKLGQKGNTENFTILLRLKGKHLEAARLEYVKNKWHFRIVPRDIKLSYTYYLCTNDIYIKIIPIRGWVQFLKIHCEIEIGTGKRKHWKFHDPFKIHQQLFKNWKFPETSQGWISWYAHSKIRKKVGSPNSFRRHDKCSMPTLPCNGTIFAILRETETSSSFAIVDELFWQEP